MPGPARLFLIDTFGLIFRAYHARARSGAPAMRTQSGVPTEAVYIFHSMLRKLLDEQRPDYVAAVFESAAPTFRDELYAQYKANRPAQPPELTAQIPYIRRLLEALRIPVLEQDRFEADDVIGALARRSAAQGLEVYIISSDKDRLQLVGEGIYVLNPAKDSLVYDAAKVQEVMGAPPERVADLLALKGDAVDNIPGAPGIGDKGAVELIRRFGSLEQALENAAQVERKTYRESLLQHRDQILLSKQLATIDTSVPVELDLETVRPAPADTARLRALYQELEFFSLLKELAPEAAQPGDYATLESEEAIRQWLREAPSSAAGLAIAPRLASPGQSHSGGGGGTAAAESIGLACRPDEGRAAAPELARSLLADPGVAKSVHDSKAAGKALAARGLRLAGVVHDTRLYVYLLDPTRSDYSLAHCALQVFGRQLGDEPAEHADFTRRLAEKLAQDIDARGLRSLYQTIELPLGPVLIRMEEAGVRIDCQVLARLSTELEDRLAELSAEIHRLAGRPFNISSPQQLGQVLFEDLKLAGTARTGKTKALSTAAAALEELAGEHEIVRLVLEHRQVAKLKGTYVDALPSLVDPSTGRLHTTFDPCGSATGRLSSSGPNLQNIPIRTELGRQIRAAFLPRPGWRLLSADYSQIELRVLAHFSRDTVLLDAFRKGEDIHTRTAAEVLGVPPLMVTANDRRRAKAINFGIVYGLSAFGLANQLGITRSEAQACINSYFERYAGVRKFIAGIIAEVRGTGMTRTLFGHQRTIPDISSRNPAARGFAERTAVNSPIQGTAADLIKLAMIAIDRRLEQERYQARLLLQVHDELLFEAPPQEIQALARMVKHEMENVQKLEAPLLVDVGVGENWRDVK